MSGAIVVEARSADGRPVTGAIVSFVVTAGGGSTSVALDTSDVAGRIATTWTVGTKAGEPQELTATVLAVTNASVGPAIVVASVTAAEPVNLDATPAVLTARMGEPLPPIAVITRDRFGNRAPAAGLWITARLDTASRATFLTPPGVRTDTSGATLGGVITGRAGATTLIVESIGMRAARVSLTLSSGKPQRLDAVNSATIDAVAGAPGPPVRVRASDEWDNPAAGVDVAFTITGVAPIGRATTGEDGVATLANWTAPAWGNYRITASSAEVPTSAQFSLATRAGPPTTLTALSSNPMAATVATEIVLAVRASDVAGNVVPNAVLSWTLGTASGEVFTDDLGVARFAVRLGTKAGPALAVVRAGSSASVTLGFQIQPGPFWQFAKQFDTLTVAAGSTFTLSYTSLDQYKNPIPGQILYAASEISSERITSVATADANGTARFTVTLDPYAATAIFHIKLDPMSGGLGGTLVYATASRGVFRLAGPESCPRLNSSGYVSGWMYGANGRAAIGVPMTWTVQPGNGYLYGDGPIVPLTSVTAQSGSYGYLTVGWEPPAGPGTYSAVAVPPPGYDAVSPVVHTCRIS